MPILGSYLIPKSMCSWIPNPKLPVSEKLFFLNSYSRTWNNDISFKSVPFQIPCVRKVINSCLPSILSPRSLQLLPHVRCNGQQSSRFSWSQKIGQCIELQNKPGFIRCFWSQKNKHKTNFKQIHKDKLGFRGNPKSEYQLRPPESTTLISLESATFQMYWILLQLPPAGISITTLSQLNASGRQQVGEGHGHPHVMVHFRAKEASHN